jgi:nitroreductase
VVDRSALFHDALLKLFDAARWVPLAFNLQPWRFAYALHDSGNRLAFLDLLIPFNRSWAQNADALVVVAASAHPTDAATSASASYFPSAIRSMLGLRGPILRCRQCNMAFIRMT